MSYCVYYHENRINHKRYVGITCTKPEQRWGTNGQRYEECPHFWHAIQKYGWENFDHVILYTGQTKDEACAKEIELIAQWNLTDPTCGYNIGKGGDGLDSDIVTNQWKNPEFKERASACMREAWKDPEKQQRRSEAATTRWANEDFKKKAVAAVTEACARPVICIETGVEYATIKAAAHAIGVSDKNAQRAIKNGYRWGGFHWKYIDDIS